MLINKWCLLFTKTLCQRFFFRPIHVQQEDCFEQNQLLPAFFPPSVDDMRVDKKLSCFLFFLFNRGKITCELYDFVICKTACNSHIQLNFQIALLCSLWT